MSIRNMVSYNRTCRLTARSDDVLTGLLSLCATWKSASGHCRTTWDLP
jgi:hypothetical protein